MNNILQTARVFTSYNGYVFPTTVETTRYRVEPITSTDKRTTLYNRFSIGLKFYIATTFGTTDAIVEQCRKALSHQGGTFVQRGRGLGDLNVSKDNDLEHGPHVQVSEGKPMGSGLAVELEWGIEFSIPHCGLFTSSGIIELNLSAAHKISLAGYTTRRVSGFLRIANNASVRSPGRSKFTADDYRESVIEPLRYGYRREFDEFRTSDDLSRLDFGWTDEEEAAVLPPGVVKAMLSDEVTSTGNGLTRWQGTFQGTYEMARGYTGMTAAEAFFSAVAQILGERQNKLGGVGANQAPALAAQAKPPIIPEEDIIIGDDGFIRRRPVQPVQPVPGPVQPPIGGGRMNNITATSPIIPTGFRAMNPDHYGYPKASFTMNYTFACSLSELLGVTELYKPIPGNWKKWYASLADNALNPYGGAGLVWQPQDSRIVDSCTPHTATLIGRPNPSQGYGEVRTQAALEELMLRSFGKPTEDSSWLEYVNEIHFESDTGVLQLKPIPNTPPQPAEALFKSDKNGFEEQFNNGYAIGKGLRVGADALVSTILEDGFLIPINPLKVIDKVMQKQNGMADIIGGIKPPPRPGGGTLVNNSEPRTIARRVRETSVAFLRGHAIRAGFPIQPPSLDLVGGVKAIAKSRIDKGEGFTTGVRTQGTTALHYASWNLRYVLDGVPDRSQVQAPTIPGQPT